MYILLCQDRAYQSSHERAFRFSAKARNGACFLFLFWGFTPLLALFLRSLRQLLGFLIEEDLGSLDQKVLTRDVDFRLIFLHNQGSQKLCAVLTGQVFVLADFCTFNVSDPRHRFIFQVVHNGLAFFVVLRNFFEPVELFSLLCEQLVEIWKFSKLNGHTFDKNTYFLVIQALELADNCLSDILGLQSEIKLTDSLDHRSHTLNQGDFLS